MTGQICGKIRKSKNGERYWSKLSLIPRQMQMHTLIQTQEHTSTDADRYIHRDRQKNRLWNYSECKTNLQPLQDCPFVSHVAGHLLAFPNAWFVLETSFVQSISWSLCDLHTQSGTHTVIQTFMKQQQQPEQQQKKSSLIRNWLN